MQTSAYILADPASGQVFNSVVPDPCPQVQQAALTQKSRDPESLFLP